jgi:hypothetical protein
VMVSVLERLKYKVRGFVMAHLLRRKRVPAAKSKQTTAVFDTITGIYIRRVPVYEAGTSCAMRGRSHMWILNSAHNKVCIRCGLVSRVASFYKFAFEVGLLKLGWVGKNAQRQPR